MLLLLLLLLLLLFLLLLLLLLRISHSLKTHELLPDMVHPQTAMKRDTSRPFGVVTGMRDGANRLGLM